MVKPYHKKRNRSWSLRWTNKHFIVVDKYAIKEQYDSNNHLLLSRAAFKNNGNDGVCFIVSFLSYSQ